MYDNRASLSPGARLMQYPDAGWLRKLFRMPLVLWRMGLGPLLGHYLLVLTHTGRKSGLPRRTMVEYHRMDRTLYVPVAFGPRAQWYQNVLADPYVTVQTAAGTLGMTARRVTDPEELLAVYALLRQRNPVMLGWYLESLGIPDTAEDVLRHKDSVYFVALEETDHPTPPPLEEDLVWVWGVLAMLLAGWRALRRRKRG
ncbi:MAG: hypothetical protein Kow0077_14970 [Anaerolineae bacterium]